MMELTDSSADELKDRSKTGESARSGFYIDLNEIPSPSSLSETPLDSIDVVRTYVDNPPPPPGGPAVVPSDVRGSSCGACGRPEVRGHVVVCDGCERGFHLGCAGMRARQALSLEDWVCGECSCDGGKSKRWPLGVKSKQLLDINSSPPSEGDACGESSEEVQELRKHTRGDKSYDGVQCDPSVGYSNLYYQGNGFSFRKDSEIVHTVKMGFKGVLNHMHNMGRGVEEVDLGLPIGRCRNSKSTASRLSSQNPSGLFLQALRDFISENHGVLEEGWHVEFKQPLDSCEHYAVYCAPDGKTFESVSEVACYLGLVSNHQSMEPKVKRERPSSFHGKSYQLKRRKSSMANGFAEHKESFKTDRCQEGFSDILCPPSPTPGTAVNNIEVRAEEKDGCLSLKFNDGLPLQFEDFFVLSLGDIDARPSYHDVEQVFPIGFRSCWHDKITGSFFTNEVIDGGDSGPVFKVGRSSCFASPLPTATTLICKRNTGKLLNVTNEESCEMNYNSYEDIHMVLSDPCPPMEDDIVSCLSTCYNDQASDKLQLEEFSVSGISGNPSCNDTNIRDEIGEISVEEYSPSLAWKKMSHSFIRTCSEVIKQKGTARFYCNHVGQEMGISNYVIMNENSNTNYGSLDKFCSSPGSVCIPSLIHVDSELDTFYDAVQKWLDQDRFGLDVAFIQEMLEQIPGIHCCSKYLFMNERNHCSKLLTVESGMLEVKREGNEKCKEEEQLNVLFGRSKTGRSVGDCVTVVHIPPPGTPMCLKVQPELIGDVYQVWDLLSRFHEILGLKEELSLEELEKELVNPWVDGSNILLNFECQPGMTQDLLSHKTSLPGKGKFFSDFESSETSHTYIQMEEGRVKEAAEAQLTSTTGYRCSGDFLTKAHKSLLRVLIGELQSRVAVLVDPNFDSGESKSRRGRKKDVDSSISAKIMKVNLLPLNELTWPELARRYILAILSMDCNLESSEIIARESGRVFRCLKGDGGVLCGSLSGVAGMEADAILLAEAAKQIFGPLNTENDVIILEEESSDTTVGSEKVLVNDGDIPEWAQVLEPVRKLPTNVGTRIRKCVYDALERNPPEWAKKILEHSISKEVYKGNASGPTKKAVLSLLADVCGQVLPQKSVKGRKKKTIISISDIIMKQCRIVLRHAAAADDAKVFCNLLGRKLMNSSDNDDEGLLGTPAMIARPLDFRTIDLRLAAGSYRGSHEAFLEDVRELWNNLRNAYGEQSDLVELAETLSRNFESLYEKEVIPLVQKLSVYPKLGSLDAECRKDVDDLIASTNEIPKAPWDEGVCKVCGVDKDDDSVLLCDTCDAEYHTYCLNPPLARIPEGNWYCPSCVGSCMVQTGLKSTCSSTINRQRSKKHRGEISRAYEDALVNLTTVMEEREYWDFSLDERLFLLKHLCDDLLNSALIRQHLEQCAETSAELQQKLRVCVSEWKSFKSREDFLSTKVARSDTTKEDILSVKAARLDTTMLNIVGEDCIRDGFVNPLANYGKILDQESAINGVGNHSRTSSDFLQGEGGSDRSGLGGSDKQASAHCVHINCKNPTGKEDQIEDALSTISEKNESCSSLSTRKEIDGAGAEISLQDKLGNGIYTLPSLDKLGLCISSDIISNHSVPHIPPVLTETHTYQRELDAVKNEILLLQDSVASLELELLKVSVRREFLGCDSLGRFYWASVVSHGNPLIIASPTMMEKFGNGIVQGDKVSKSSLFQDFSSSSISHTVPSEGSKVCHSSLHHPSICLSNCPLFSYQTDADIEKLLNWLKEKDPNERELKNSILHWKKFRFQASQQSKNQDCSDPLPVLSKPANGEIVGNSSCVTRAATLLKKKYGPCFELESSDILKKQLKRGRLTNDQKMFRCECLEPIWPSRSHCLFCHKTFITDIELEGHNDGKCSLGSPTDNKNKEISDALNGHETMTADIIREENSGKDGVETSNSWCTGINSTLVKFQNDGLVCPYDFEVVCSKFMTNDSNKDLIQEIGLIGSNGIPSLVPRVSYLRESPVTLSSLKDGCVSRDSSLDDWPVSEENLENARKPGVTENNEGIKTKKSDLGYLGKKSRKPSFGCQFSEMGNGRICVVPQASLRTLVGKVSQVARLLKINLLDMDAALPQEAFRSTKFNLEKRWAWRAFVKSAKTIYEMVQATIVWEDMIRTDYLKNEWWYWSSHTAAARTSTMSSLALRIYSLDSAIIYEKNLSGSDLSRNLDCGSISIQKLLPGLESTEKSKTSRKSNKKRKEPDG